MGARRVPGLNKLVFLQSMNTQKGMRQGGRKKGTPNKLTAERVLKNYVEECLEKRRTYEPVEYKPDEMAAFALCVQVLETIKRNKKQDDGKD